MNNNQPCNYVIKARESAQLSQKELATKVNCSDSHISKIEKGSGASPKLAKRIAKVLGIPPHAVIYPDEPFITETELPDALTTGVM